MQGFYFCVRNKKMRTIILALVFASVITGHAQTRSDATAPGFTYNQSLPLNVKEVSTERRGDVTVRDIVFVPRPGGHEVKAYVVTPPGDGPFAGVLWVHWLGDEKSNRSQFLDEAVELAPKGIVSVLVDTMWAEPRWFGDRNPANDYENSIKQVIELRRALDLLFTQPHLDKTRIAYVGHDFGAMYGMLMAGVDKRAKTYVFIAATQSLNDWAFLGPQPKSKSAYLKQNSTLELTDSLRKVTNASKFFQFGKSDFFVSQADAAVLFAAAGEPKKRKLYETGHKMDLKEIMVDRDNWLTEQLMIK